jgi:hypothetical protein
MELDYLLFDATDEETGSWSFDAMASVAADRLPALLREIEAVLGWAWREFGAPSIPGEDGEWGFDLQAMGDNDLPLDITYDAERAQVSLPVRRDGRVTVTLTVTGPSAFAAAFREAFSESE